MIGKDFVLTRYDADIGCVFDWKEPHYEVDADGNEIQQHLYAKTLFIGAHDSIDNYIEIEEEA